MFFKEFFYPICWNCYPTFRRIIWLAYICKILRMCDPDPKVIAMFSRMFITTLQKTGSKLDDQI